IIVGIVVAIYLNNQNQSFQIQFAKIQLENSLAHLQVKNINTNGPRYSSVKKMEDDVGGLGFENYPGYEIMNSGLSTANNVKIILALRFINESWSKTIKNIKGFTIETNPETLVSS